MTRRRRIEALEAKLEIHRHPTVVELDVTNVSTEVAVDRYLMEHPGKSQEDFFFICRQIVGTDPLVEAESLKRRDESTVADVDLQEIVM